ncbi:MAG: hypothetical protein AAF211_24405 [Myxococcota bacterium]
MSWRSLLGEGRGERVLPWVGGRGLLDRDRSFVLAGIRPDEHGWHRFAIDGTRRARWVAAAEPDPMWSESRSQRIGTLIGDRLAPDGAAVVADETRLLEQTVSVHLVPRGLPRFSRVRIARDPGGPWICVDVAFPLGPEPDVADAFADDRPDLAHLRGVPPALDLAFRVARAQRDAAERRREALERQRRIAQARARDQDREWLARSARGRRAVARVDFETAARAALAVSSAEYLDHWQAVGRGETTVQFRFAERRFECVVETTTLRIVDAGICLIDHATNERGDERFTLESLPGVIRQALDGGELVVFRHF